MTRLEALQKARAGGFILAIRHPRDFQTHTLAYHIQQARREEQNQKSGATPDQTFWNYDPQGVIEGSNGEWYNLFK